MSATSGSKSKKDKHKHRSTSTTQQLDPRDLAIEYRQKGSDSWDETWKLLHSSEWKVEAGTDLHNGVVYAQHVQKHGKVFMLKGYVDASPEFVFKNTVLTLEDSPKWNSMVTGISTLQVIDDNCDISYNVTADVAGGIVSSRDFVGVRFWKTQDGILMSAGCSVEHPDKPPTKKCIRGENKPGGWIYMPVEDNANKCIFAWIVNTDIKGWIPRYIVEQTLYVSLLDYLKELRLHIANMKSTAE